MAMKGAIVPTDTWRVRGVTSLHTLSLDCGRFGRGPMHLRADTGAGQTFPKPSRGRPFVLAPTINLDGRKIAVAATTTDFGDSVQVDVFVDDESLLDGSPIAALEGRRREVIAASNRYVSPYEAVSAARVGLETARRLVPVFATATFAAQARSHPLLVVAGLWVAFLLVSIGVPTMLLRTLPQAPPRGPSRRFYALSVLVLCWLVELGLFLAIQLGPLHP